MNMWITYGIIAVILLVAELVYFRIADKCNIIDKPNERSSHSTIVLRGGGIIFAISIIVWMIWQMVQGEWLTVNGYLPFVIGLVLVAGVSFWDDIHSLPQSFWFKIQGSRFKVFNGYSTWVGIGKLLLWPLRCSSVWGQRTSSTSWMGLMGSRRHTLSLCFCR